MANLTFNGTGNIVADKNTDTVTIAVDPQTFQSAVQSGSNVVLSFTSGTITINGTTLADDGLPNVFLQGGKFEYIATDNPAAPLVNSNVLSFLETTSSGNTYVGTSADSKIAAFGGRGQFDAADTADTIGIGGKGSFLVHGNGGNDTITQVTDSTAAFDSTSVVNVYGDQGSDSIILTNAANSKASIFVSAGESTDVVSVINSGSTTIFGGLDSTDLGDTITLVGVNGATGTSVIFGNGGADSITVGGASNALDSTSTTTVYGGVGVDSITVFGNKATINVLGGESADLITVTNSGQGTTYITGGNQSGDQVNDGADTISFTGGGNAFVFGNVGADSITLTLSDSANVSVYGGKDNDIVNIGAGSGSGKHSIFVAGGEGLDTINVVGNGGAVTIYGGISNSDATDSADLITYSGSGTANIFGNGGDDSINIGTLGGLDSTNAQVNVSGGGGADSINVAAQGFNQQALNISGNDGADTFQIATGAGRNVTITDFAVTGTAADTLKITGAGTGGTLGLVGDTFTNDQLQAALNAASTKAAAGTVGFSNVAAVRVGSDTYVVIEKGGPGFDATTDQAIKLTGVSDLAGLQGHTVITA